MGKFIHGWNPDIPDIRDYKFVKPSLGGFAESVDLESQCPPVVDQSTLGCCVGNSTSNGFLFTEKKEGKPHPIIPARLFIYYNARKMEGTVKQDSGCQIRDAMKSIATLGVCDESKWAYNISKFTNKPPVTCYKQALSHTAVQYQRLNNTNIADLLGCLSSGYPFVFGFSVYESFESQEVANTGIVNMPLSSEKLLGGHAVLCVGYDNATQRFKVMNSWGTGWGQKGYFTIPYSYLTNNNLADDFWNMQLVK